MRISGWSSDVCSSDLRGDGLALQMAATLGKSLIFQLYHRGAGFFEAAHRAHHIQRIAETGVAVHDNRQLYPVGYARQGLLDFRVGGKAHIGRSEEHTSELQSIMRISYAVFCLKKK